MPGLVPGIHVLGCCTKGVDGRVKPGHDGECGWPPRPFAYAFNLAIATPSRAN